MGYYPKFMTLLASHLFRLRRSSITYWNIMDYDALFNRLIRLHAFFPYYLFGGKALPPFRIQIETTYSCNLRCPYCYQDDEYKKEKEELRFDEIKNLLRQIPSFSLVTLSGGEPFYRKDFPALWYFSNPFDP